MLAIGRRFIYNGMRNWEEKELRVVREQNKISHLRSLTVFNKTVKTYLVVVCSLMACTISVIGDVYPKAWKLSPLTPHPRLFVSGDADFAVARKRLDSSSAGRVGLATLMKNADKFLDYPNLERKMKGIRLLDVSRDALNRISFLAFAWKMTGNEKYAVRAAHDARVVCRFLDWNQSHFLDTAEMTLAVAIALDWLDGYLSNEDKVLMSDAILRKGLTKGDGRTLSSGPWIRYNNNWNMVCHGSLAAGAAVVRDEYPAVAEAILFRARKYLPMAMKAFADGNFPEGPGYWMYALEFTAVAVEVLERQFRDGTPELLAIDGFREQADYMNYMTGPTGLLYNYSDPYPCARARRWPSPASYYLAKRFDRVDSLVQFELPLMREGRGLGRLHALGLLWFPDRKKEADVKVPLSRAFSGENPLAILRNGIGREDWYIGVKGGTPYANHGHMDAGSFVLDAGGVRWAYDLGCEDYNRIEQSKTVSLWNRAQNSTRWSLFRLGTHGHGTLVVDNVQQNVKGCAKIVAFRKGHRTETEMDLTSLYPICRKVLRKFSLDMDGGCVISDILTGVKSGTVVEWNMNTAANVVVNGNVLLLEDKAAFGMLRRMKLVASPADISWEVLPLDVPSSPLDSPNPGMKRIRFKRSAKSASEMRLSVSFKLESIPVKEQTF